MNVGFLVLQAWIKNIVKKYVDHFPRIPDSDRLVSWCLSVDLMKQNILVRENVENVSKVSSLEI